MADCYSVKLAIGYKFSCKKLFSKEDSSYDDRTLLETFADLVGCKFFLLGSCWNLTGKYSDTSVIFCPNKDPDIKTGVSWDDKDYDLDNAEFGNSFDYDTVVNMKPELDELKQKLQELGLKPGKPGVYLAYKIS